LEILDLRHFSSVDLRPLLEDETRAWRDLLSWDYSGSAEMILRYVDAKILPGYAAINRGRIFGYSFFVYEGSKGVIGDLYVADGGRLPDPHQIESQLLTHVIETLQQSPGIHRVEAQLLMHESGVVSRSFVEQGFQRYARLFMVVPLVNTKAAPPLHTEVEIRPWSEQDYQPAATVINTAYRGHVDSEVNDQYRSLSGSLRFLNNIVRFPGCGTFDPESPAGTPWPDGKWTGQREAILRAPALVNILFTAPDIPLGPTYIRTALTWTTWRFTMNAVSYPTPVSPLSRESICRNLAYAAK